MRRFLMVWATAVFVGCLAFVFPSRAMAEITSGTVSCPEGKATKMIVNNMEGYGCVKQLGVRPPHGGGGSSNPDDWGMCGVLSLSGQFGPPTVAQVIVDPTSGYYEVQVFGYMPGYVPTLDWTCVLFSDFRGVPPVSEATSSGAPPDGWAFNGGSTGGIYGRSETIPHSAGNACIWSGLFGDLTLYVTADQSAEGAAYAQYDGLESSLGSKNVTSYAFCSGYSSASWRGWKYLHTGFEGPVPAGGLHDSQYWCYMNGVLVNNIQGSITAIDVGMKLSGGTYSSVATSPFTYMGYNCLYLEQ
jgi:hypothetical protein